MKTIIEPFRIESVEPLRHTTAAQREEYLERAWYSLAAPVRPNLWVFLDDMVAEQEYPISARPGSDAGSRPPVGPKTSPGV